ncbi:MAG: ArnT family glycosyltransferase [Alkalilacustris sp.]
MAAARTFTGGSAQEAPPMHWVWLVILAGMALRLLWALVFPVNPISDSFAYHTYATNLVQHGVHGLAPEHPGAYWPVGTSAIVAATYLILGETFAGVVATNLLAGFVTLVLVHRLGTVYFGPAAGFWATVVVAFWPNLIMFTSILSSELYFIALSLVGLYFWQRAEVGVGRRGRWGNVVLCGLAFGAACYVRPIALLMPAALALVPLAQGFWPFLRAAAHAAVVTVIVLAVLSPWTYRNYLVFGEPVLVSTNFGANLWMGNNPESTGEYMPLPRWTRGMSETERARALGDIAKAYIREDPLRFARNVAVRAVRLHDRETIGVHWNLAAIQERLGRAGDVGGRLLATGYWYLVLLGGLAGTWVLGRRRIWDAAFNPAFAIWSYVTLLHAIVVIQDRYHMPSSPYIAMLAGVAIAALLQRRAAARAAPS